MRFSLVYLFLVFNLRYIFRCQDKDNSGEIDFVEYLIAISVITRGSIREKLRMSFEIFDLDKNGTIDQDEMKGDFFFDTFTRVYFLFKS